MKYQNLATIVLTAALAFCAIAARADHRVNPPRMTQTVPMAPGVVHHVGMKEFDSIEEAAVFAMARIYEWSHYYEAGGVIGKLADGKFAVSRPYTNWSGKQVDLENAYDPDNYPAGTQIVGDYHQHPCNSNRFVPGVFSPNDLKEYRIFRVEGFVLDMCTGNVHAFKPGVDKELDPGETAGRIIGKIPVDGKVTDTDIPVRDGSEDE
jgi:hypothetical protein